MSKDLPITKDQRHTAYIIIQEEVKNKEHFAFCVIAYSLFCIDLDEDGYFNNFKKYFPELYALKDKDENDAFLWDNTERRKAALQQVINQTA